MSVQKRIEIERKVVRKLIRMAKEIGYSTVSVYDGEEWHRDLNESTAMDHVFSVDESHIRFTNTDGDTYRVFIVLGNDGYDAVCDHTMNRNDEHPWNVMMNSHFEYCEQFCP